LYAIGELPALSPLSMKLSSHS